MATFTTHHAASGNPFVAGRLSHFFAAVVSWNNTRITRNALRKLSSRELEDIGLSRSDIDTLV